MSVCRTCVCVGGARVCVCARARYQVRNHRLPQSPGREARVQERVCARTCSVGLLSIGACIAGTGDNDAAGGGGGSWWRRGGDGKPASVWMSHVVYVCARVSLCRVCVCECLGM